MSRPPTDLSLGFGVRADTLDFRDNVYRPNLVAVPEVLDPSRLGALGVPVLDQQVSFACTGFALATVANALLRMRNPAAEDVSPEMLYAMARRYDEYPGTTHNGSSLRGAMKGWHRHGVCARRVWENEAVDGRAQGALGVLTRARARDAASRPLGAYYRVDGRDLSAVHCALAEVGVMAATLRTHDGWFDLFTDPEHPLLAVIESMAPPGARLGRAGAASRNFRPEAGQIAWPAPDTLGLGLHAVAVVGYDGEGIWVQNSLGRGWGAGGRARIRYDDWLANVTDAWVARLGVPIHLSRAQRHGKRGAAGGDKSASWEYAEMRSHLLPVGVDGRLATYGTYATSADDVRSILRDEIRAETETWPARHLLFLVPGGLGTTEEVVTRSSELRALTADHHVYPLLLLWNDGFGARLEEILRRAAARAGEAAHDDRFEVTLESLCRRLGGWIEWDHVKRQAAAAVEEDGALAVALDELDGAWRDAELDGWPFDVNLVAQGAGAWLVGHFVARWTALGRPIRSLTLCAPACSIAFFKRTMLPAVRAGAVERFVLVTLPDARERADHVAGVYERSFLYLVSNALEETQRVPPADTGTPLLGLARHVKADAELDGIEHVVSRAEAGDREVDTSTAQHHRDFLRDPATLRLVLNRITRA